MKLAPGNLSNLTHASLAIAQLPHLRRRRVQIVELVLASVS